MPFRLKSTGATFQRMIKKVFVKQIGRNVGAYVDEIVVKSENTERNVDDLEKVFNILRKFRVKLN